VVPEREPVCLPGSTIEVVARVDGALVRLERHTSTSRCQGAPVETVVPVAAITLPAEGPRCPVGQVAARAGRHEVLLAVGGGPWLWEALDGLAPTAEAFVIGCPTPERTDFLLLERAPRGAEPKVALLVDEVLRFDRRDARVAFWPSLVPEPPAPPLSGPRVPARVPCATAGATPTWFARERSVGVGAWPPGQRTVAIGRSGTQAWVTIEQRTAAKGDCEQVASLEGTVAEVEGQQVFRFTQGEQVIWLTCRPRPLTVASSRALRVNAPSDQEGCNRHRWKPAPSVPVTALECRSDDWVEWRQPVFLGPGAGLEHVTSDHDDCWAPEEALRALEAGRALAPVH
jgi:hypothetical protein